MEMETCPRFLRLLAFFLAVAAAWIGPPYGAESGATSPYVREILKCGTKESKLCPNYARDDESSMPRPADRYLIVIRCDLFPLSGSVDR
jgi:hypothetical protein